jgi:membrane-associated phospholipid phosphatase
VLVVAATTLCLTSVAQPLRAETALKVASGWETVGTLSACGLVGVFELQRSAWSPRQCSWCKPPAIDSDARAAFKWQNTQRASLLSNVAVAVEPLALIGGLVFASRERPAAQRYDDVLLLAESAALAEVLVSITKVAVARERPRVYGLSVAERAQHKFETEDNLSFFSSHTNFAFVLATSAGTVASLRDYPMAPWVWGIGLALASSAGYLRVAADAHYLSDVLSGALIGSAIGVGVPLLHRSSRLAMSIQPLAWRGAHGMSISGSL